MSQFRFTRYPTRQSASGVVDTIKLPVDRVFYNKRTINWCIISISGYKWPNKLPMVFVGDIPKVNVT